MKKCGKCQILQPLEQFCRAAKNADGLQYSCRTCDNKRDRKEQNKRAAKKRKAYLTAYMRSFKEGACVDCGIQYPPHVMQFDHLDPSKKSFTLGSVARLGKSEEAIRAEIAKCDLVCANCHLDREWHRKEMVIDDQ